MPRKGEASIAVIIPTYQEEKYIGRLLSQLVRVDYPLEIIVVDGGSKDRTVEIAKEYTDKVYQMNQRGIPKAKNYGASRSRAEILLFLDADVNVPPNFTDKLIEAFSDKRVVGATCNIMPAEPRPLEFAFFLLYNLLLRFFSKFKPHCRGEFMAVRRDKFMEAGGFDEDLPCQEDHEFAMRVSKLGRFVFINDLTVYETMRRFRRLGLLKVVKTWFIDYIYLTLFGMPLSKTWRAIR